MYKKERQLVDEGIYLNEDRYEKPKEAFKFIADLIEKKGRISDGKLLDVGCATGELIYYLKGRFNYMDYTGIDISPSMIEKARCMLPDEEFLVKSIFDDSFLRKRKFEYIICSGLLSLFDDVKTPLMNLLSATKKGSQIIIMGGFNEHPIDVITKYRLPDIKDEKDNGEWKIGWNIFSKKTYENILLNSGYELSLNWHDFRMPFSIPKRDDPMRTWTIRTEDDPHQLVNGASQIINVKLLDIEIKEVV